MFENINFHIHDTGIWNRHTLHNLIQTDHVTDTIADMVQKGTTIQEKNQFLMEGTMDMMFPFPVNKKNRQRLYCPQFFSYCHCGSNFYFRRKDFESYLILMTYGGNARLEYEGKTYHLRKGQGIFIDCRKEHYYHTEGEFWVHSCLHFEGNLASEWFEEFFHNNDVVFEVEKIDAYQTLLENILLLWQKNEPYKELKWSNAVSDLIAYLLTLKSRKCAIESLPDTYLYLRKYIESNFKENLSLDYLSSLFSLSKYHLSREFKHYVGMSPIQYLISIRIENAQSLLLYTNQPIYVIAETVGFNDLNNFTRHFSKKIGMTPSEYRKTLSSDI